MGQITKHILATCLLCLCMRAQSQTIINTSDLAHDLDSGIRIGVNYSGNFSVGNLILYDLNLNGVAGLSLSKYSSIWFAGGINQLKTDVSQIANTHYYHLRYNYHILPKTTIQFYYQNQTNDILLFKNRQLAGVNTNFDIYNDNHFICLGAFYESENYLTEEPLKQTFRGNILLVLKGEKSKIKWATLLFMQPSVENVSDYRAIWNSDLTYEILNNLNIGLALNGRYDSKPHGNLERYDFNLLTMLTYEI